MRSAPTCTGRISAERRLSLAPKEDRIETGVTETPAGTIGGALCPGEIDGVASCRHGIGDPGEGNVVTGDTARGGGNRCRGGGNRLMVDVQSPFVGAIPTRARIHGSVKGGDHEELSRGREIYGQRLIGDARKRGIGLNPLAKPAVGPAGPSMPMSPLGPWMPCGIEHPPEPPRLIDRHRRWP